MAANLIPAGRRAGILSFIKDKGFASVEELASRFEVSVITIRRDLDQLESDNLIERTHGGAIYTRHIAVESSYTEKNSQNRENKNAIGMRAAELAAPGETVFVNNGSTTHQIIRALLGIRNIRIVTNNIVAVLEADPGPDCELILVGGRYRFNSGCTIGSFAEAVIRQLNVSRTFIGADGISLKSGITSPVAEEAAITRMMIEHTAGEITIAADSSKIGKISTFFISSLKSIDNLVTDNDFDEKYRPDFEEAGIKIITTGNEKITSM